MSWSVYTFLFQSQKENILSYEFVVLSELDLQQSST